MVYTQVVDNYNNHPVGQLSSDNHHIKNPTVFTVYLKTDVSPSHGD